MGENFPGKDKSILYSKPVPRTMPGVGGGIQPQVKGIMILSVITPEMFRKAVDNAVKSGVSVDEILNILYDFRKVIGGLISELEEAKEGEG